MSAGPMHEHFEQDAAPYVLGALTEAEHEAFTAHLAECRSCREQVASLQRVAAALPASAPQLASPPELKSRVITTVRSEAALRAPRRAATAGRGSVIPRGLPVARRARLALGAAAAAIAAVLAIALAGSGGSGSAQRARVVQAQVVYPQASASIRMSGGHAELDVSDMPQSPSGRVYEVWVKRSGGPLPTDALFTVSAAGRAAVGVPGSIDGVKTIMVTAEPRGGSTVPTGPPVIVASL